MSSKAVLLVASLMVLFACTQGKQYRDTTALEMPPQLAVVESGQTKPSGVDEKEDKNALADSVFLDDLEKPTVLSIKKLFDRAWELVEEALEKKGIEITDKNRENGELYVKYDASDDSGSELFGNVKIFIFEEEYAEADYKLTVAWHETSTEVRAQMLKKNAESTNEDGEELGDGSPKLIKALYDTIRNELTE